MQTSIATEQDAMARALRWMQMAPGDVDGPLIQQLLSEGVVR